MIVLLLTWNLTLKTSIHFTLSVLGAETQRKEPAFLQQVSCLLGHPLLEKGHHGEFI